MIFLLIRQSIIRSHRLTVRTGGFQSPNRGSIPRGTAIKSNYFLTNRKSSARSVLGFDIGTLIISAVQKNILKRGGGHKMAAGFSIEEKKIEEF